MDPAFIPASFLVRELRGERGPGELSTVLSTGLGDWRKPWLLAQIALRKRSGLRWDGALACRDAFGELIRLVRREAKEPYAGLLLEAYLGKGVAHIELGEYEDAVEHLAVAHHLTPASIEPPLFVGKARLASGNVQRAEVVFYRLLDDVGPERSTEVNIWVATLYAAVKDWQRALDWAGQLSRASSARARLECYVEQRCGGWERAVGAARKLTDVAGDDPSAWRLLGTTLLDVLARERNPPSVENVAEFADVAAEAFRLDPENFRVAALVRTAWSNVRRIPRHWMETEPMRRAQNALLALPLVLATAPAVADELCSDFTGAKSPFGGQPVHWAMDEIRPGEAVSGVEGLRLVRESGQGNAMVLHTEESFSGDIRIQMSVLLEGHPWHPALYAHAGPNDSAYWGSIEFGGSNLALGGAQNNQIRFKYTTPVDFALAGEVEIELLRRGDTLELRAWRSDGTRPVTPQLQAMDGVRHAGSVGFQCEEGLVRSICIEDLPEEPTPPTFRRGDTDGDGGLGLADAVQIFGYLFLGAPAELSCEDAADADDSGTTEMTDGIGILNHLFLGGPAPSAPGSEDCGEDPTEDELDCATNASCV